MNDLLSSERFWFDRNVGQVHAWPVVFPTSHAGPGFAGGPICGPAHSHTQHQVRHGTDRSRGRSPVGQRTVSMGALFASGTVGAGGGVA